MPVDQSLPRRSIGRGLLAVWAGSAAAVALAQSGTPPAEEAAAGTVVVTGSARAMRTLDLPFAVSAVDSEALRGAGPMVNLSEALARVPGLVANNRSNFAQDLQISSRGFGARASFGVRGLRLYADGIPATMPDGQGQVAHIDLAGAQRVEVLRGPFSVLYGNSSGGVIAVFSPPVTGGRSELALDVGSFGLLQERLQVAQPLDGGLSIVASGSRFGIDGFRPQSGASRALLNLRLGWQAERDKVTLLVSGQDQHAKDALGLTAAEFAADPRGVTSTATVAAPYSIFQYDTRKSIQQQQAGVNWRHDFGDGGALRDSSLTAYAGHRSVTQFQAIAPTTQDNSAAQPAATATWRTQAGAVPDFDRDYRGVDLRLGWQFAGVDLVTGVAAEDLTDERRGYENFAGSATSPTSLGVVGKPRRNETNHATTRDAYAQLQWPLSSALSLTGGVRVGQVSMNTADHYIVTGNGDDSGALSFSYVNPVLGLRWTLAPGWTVHASAARGFESPTLTELAYKPAGQAEAGFNQSLQGQTSRQAEVGSKWRGAGLELDVAVFQADTENEIGTLSNVGGRSVFRNVGRTQRRGLEASTAWQVTPALRGQLALTWLQAEYLDAFSACTGTPCNPLAATPQNVATVAPGNRIAGTSAAMAYADIAWRPGVVPGEFGLEWRAMGRVAANDLNTAWAAGYGLAALRWRGSVPLGERDALELLARLDNVFDRVYAGSVIVNEGNSRYFETGAPRNALLSLRWQHRW